ncbi:hypothetical protein COCCADRAFT_102101 [Bipolaris zeicola 26-R-13]|uniref:Uncharacterized protein n=1 Tax=Cochliobolus carbonum (strain 26-R-13) TaxID=930089 RepID=W6Y0N5_COCC2|nr:uncharacterized protein COCCADRAFT_102101 [Bipolaris zeicola 26-R-13]EUC31140.1 hypothetical protein COCCADRAFT_102101 [Bipolaris zeicola 26-R-13]
MPVNRRRGVEFSIRPAASASPNDEHETDGTAHIDSSLTSPEPVDKPNSAQLCHCRRRQRHQWPMREARDATAVDASDAPLAC